jgi:hypothetical protein
MILTRLIDTVAWLDNILFSEREDDDRGQQSDNRLYRYSTHSRCKLPREIQFLSSSNRSHYDSKIQVKMMKLAPFALLLASASAFAPQQGPARLSTELAGNTKTPPVVPLPKDVSYGEVSRVYRRTVYTHDDWIIHRSPDRFLRNILSTPKSGIYQNIGREVFATVSISVLVVSWNMVAGGYTDFSGVTHDAVFSGVPMLSLAMTPFSLAAPFLGLILGK